MRILVVAAHPDDEALGCGATMARYAAGGTPIEVLFLTDGVGARRAQDEQVLERRTRSEQACSVLGIQPPRFSDFPDNQMDSVPLLEVVQVVEKMISEFAPSVIYTHHGGDLNVDHRVCHHAVLTACRPQPNATVRSIYGFEVPSSTEWASEALPEFRPARFVDVSSWTHAKTAALAAYGDEIREWPHARSLEAVDALMKWRGASVGLERAEAFSVIREIL